ncbi:hypothetical protein FOA52_007979 [Chlamydomonas sp. UWO 241]|nr:hypothetical protein FOA52_007979 [Chlamydomonas sp. UWO 241]
MLALHGSAWRCMGARPPGCPPRSSLMQAHAGVRRPTAGLGGSMLTRAPASSGGGGARALHQLRRPVLAAAMQEAQGRGSDSRKSSSYKGVCWDKGNSAWRVDLQNPETKRREYVGSYASEQDAARAFDCAAVNLRGLDTVRNFPDEVFSEMPATKGDRRRERKTSRFSFGVRENKRSSSWMVGLWDPQTKREQYIGTYASEVDAARAYDCAAVKLRGLDTKRNFPGEVISEPPVSLGDERRESKTSRFIGVDRHKHDYVWRARLNSEYLIRTYASEEDAARAYDCAAVKLLGLDTERNFPDEVISEPPVSLGHEQRERKTSRFRFGVSRNTNASGWDARVWSPETQRQVPIGIYDSEEDAARAYDCVAVQLHGPDWPKLNFPGEVITAPPESRGDKKRRLKASQ